MPSQPSREYAALMIRLRILGVKNNLLISQREIAGCLSSGSRAIVASGARCRHQTFIGSH
jgi:hypothetical protein